MYNITFYSGTLEAGDYNKEIAYKTKLLTCKAIIRDNLNFTTKNIMLLGNTNDTSVAKDVILPFYSIPDIRTFLQNKNSELYVLIFQDFYRVSEVQTLAEIKINNKTYESSQDKPFYLLSLMLKKNNYAN